MLGVPTRSPVSKSPPIELHLLGWSGPNSKTLRSFDVFDQEQIMKKHFFSASFELQGPWNHAHSFDLNESFKMVVSRPLCDRIRPQFCQCYVCRLLKRSRKSQLWKPHENRRPSDHAHVKVQDMVRRLHLLKHLCDQMAPELCHLQISWCFAVW